jgi:tetratricopeptide (TPR) repeat protein
VADYPGEPRYESFFGAILNDSALLAMDQGDLTRARDLLRRADAHQRAALTVDPRNPRYRAFSRNHREMLALALIQLGERSEAETILRRSIAMGEALVSDFPLVPAHREDLSGSYGNLATLLIGMGPGRREEALRAFDQAGKLLQSLVAEYPGVPSYRHGLAICHHNRGLLFRDGRRWKEAEQSYRAAIDLAEALMAADPTDAARRKDLADWKDDLAKLLSHDPDAPVHDPPQLPDDVFARP